MPCFHRALGLQASERAFLRFEFFLRDLNAKPLSELLIYCVSEYHWHVLYHEHVTVILLGSHIKCPACLNVPWSLMHEHNRHLGWCKLGDMEIYYWCDWIVHQNSKP